MSVQDQYACLSFIMTLTFYCLHCHAFAGFFFDFFIKLGAIYKYYTYLLAVDVFRASLFNI